MPNTKHYFAVDGNYGDAEDLMIVDTVKWTDDDWDKIAQASDSERIGVVEDIVYSHNMAE